MASQAVDVALSRLSLEEKISLLAGGEVWSTVPIPEKGIPCVKTTDGPNGARGSKIKDGMTAACFPAACSVAATFDVELARRLGVALGEEAQTKGARCLLAPTVCIHRHPLGGRNFESFSEDPFLSGLMGIAYVEGLQSTGVSATVKHFAVNEQETQRLNVNAVVSEKALREIYLKPFELIVKRAKPWALMTAYNKINGFHADSNEFLLKKVLRDEWKWEGLVMSDWGGTNSTAEALSAGTDLEMPGPTRWRKIDDVLSVIATDGTIERSVHESAGRVIRFLQRLGCLENPTWSDPGERSVNNPEHAALIREAGSKGIVLLKNKNETLPLTKKNLSGKKVAVLGYAKDVLAHGGGSASVKPHYKVTPWEALLKAFEGVPVDFVYSKGAHTFRQLPLLFEGVRDMEGNLGFTCNIRHPASTDIIKVLNGWNKSEISLLDDQMVENVEVDLIGTFCPEETASYYFTLSGLGPSRLSIDGTTMLQQQHNCLDPMGFLFGGIPVPRTAVQLEKGVEYKVLISASPPVPQKGRDVGFLEGQVGVRVGCMSATLYDADILAEAVTLAEQSDYAIVFTGRDPSWETEGQDLAGFNLPRGGSQDDLVAAVTNVCPRTIVVNSTGGAVALPWLDQVDALLQTWFPGQEAGHSIVDILIGARNPEGHLPCTFPKMLEDCPAYGNFPGREHDIHGLEVEYAEGIFVGYRHFDRLAPEKVNFPFGFGLSYTKFDIERIVVREEPNDSFVVEAKVLNTGPEPGAVAVQVYVGPNIPSPTVALRTLVGFRKVQVSSGCSKVVNICVRTQDFASWDDHEGRWAIEEGDYVFSVARSSADLVLSSTVALKTKYFDP